MPDLAGVQGQGDAVVPVDDPVAVGVLHDVDRRQVDEPIVGPTEALPARVPVAAAERLERQEVAAALVAAADRRAPDVGDVDGPHPDVDPARAGPLRVPGRQRGQGWAPSRRTRRTRIAGHARGRSRGRSSRALAGRRRGAPERAGLRVASVGVASSGPRRVGSLEGIAAASVPQTRGPRGRVPGTLPRWRASGAGTAGVTRPSRSSSARTRARQWPSCSDRARRPRDATLEEVVAAAPPSRLAPEPGLSLDPLDRVRHARGQDLPDAIALRSGRLPALPDAVARPDDAAGVRDLLARADAAGWTLLPRGGGTSVVGGVTVVPSRRPVVVVDLGGLAGVRHIDPVSGLATVGAGTLGPDLEAALGASGRRLGHVPQSWAFSSVGGWVATRSSGAWSMGYGRIEDLFAGGHVETPAGPLDLPTVSGQRRRTGPARDRPRLGGPARRAHRGGPAHGADSRASGRACVQPARLGTGARRRTGAGQRRA